MWYTHSGPNGGRGGGDWRKFKPDGLSTSNSKRLRGKRAAPDDNSSMAH